MANRKHQMCEKCSSQSLMSVLNKFVETVNIMDEKVMVPSRLRDMQLNQNSNLEPTEENNNMAVLPFTSGNGEDLYSYYEMINAVKGELLSGKGPLSSHRITSLSESDGDSDTLSDDSSDDGVQQDAATKTAQAFRHHLQGLFGLLHQLSDTAKFLGDAYEDQVGVKKTKKFTI
ncbi:mid1-interacting protein 1-like [Ruditapes philippinarum]|uniref:mid1-interacting protein 1-like n=1 Tax=Ruditapes philippinarum TaxID=129788 RepID=UPI00295BE8BD|nr:mid1-interacting protein 1-like [Ruditapes philippinarum]